MAEKRKTGFMFEEIYLWHDAAMGAFPVQPGQTLREPRNQAPVRDLARVQVACLTDCTRSRRPRFEILGFGTSG